MPKRHTYAFTLVELLIALSILGIVSSIAMPLYISAIADSRVTTAGANAKALAAAIQTDVTRKGGVDYANYKTTLPTETVNYLGGSVPDNPCSSTTGYGGYTVTASNGDKMLVITPKDENCKGAALPSVTLVL
jgi:prepilin-type N-terminal cleavage/methylation domain-containing protein